MKKTSQVTFKFDLNVLTLWTILWIFNQFLSCNILCFLYFAALSETSRLVYCTKEVFDLYMSCSATKNFKLYWKIDLKLIFNFLWHYDHRNVFHFISFFFFFFSFFFFFFYFYIFFFFIFFFFFFFMPPFIYYLSILRIFYYQFKCEMSSFLFYIRKLNWNRKWG